MKHIFHAISMLALLAGCTMSQEETTTVTVNLSEKVSAERLFNYIQIDSIVPIETQDQSVGEIDKMVRTGSKVYMLDKMQDIIFRMDVVSKEMKAVIDYKGKAKNEYLHIRDFCLDTNNRIYILDDESWKINVYDAEGTFQRSFRTEGLSAIAASDKGEVAAIGEIDEEEALFHYSPEGKLLRTVEYDKPCKFLLDCASNITCTGEGFEYTLPGLFQLYESNGEKENCLCTFDLREAQYNVSEYAALTDYGDFLTKIQKEYKVMNLENVSHYGHCSILCADGEGSFIYDHEQGVSVPLMQAESPYEMLLSSAIHVNSFNGEFCSIISSNCFEEGYLQSICEEPEKYQGIKYRKAETSDDEMRYLLIGRTKD